MLYALIIVTLICILGAGVQLVNDQAQASITFSKAAVVFLILAALKFVL